MNVRPEYEPLAAEPTAEPLSEDGKLTRQERWLAEQFAHAYSTAGALGVLRGREAEFTLNVEPATGGNRAQRRAARRLK